MKGFDVGLNLVQNVNRLSGYMRRVSCHSLPSFSAKNKAYKLVRQSLYSPPLALQRGCLRRLTLFFELLLKSSLPLMNTIC